jgi:hypothetical protein
MRGIAALPGIAMRGIAALPGIARQEDPGIIART